MSQKRKPRLTCEARDLPNGTRFYMFGDFPMEAIPDDLNEWLAMNTLAKAEADEELGGPKARH